MLRWRVAARWGYWSESRISAKNQVGAKEPDLAPDSMSRSTVVIGATTINGMLWRIARTAALYVPIYAGWHERVAPVQVGGAATLLAVSPFFAILSAPTAAEAVKRRDSRQTRGRMHTNGVDRMVLEERANHGVDDHRRWDLECLQLQSCQAPPYLSKSSLVLLQDDSPRALMVRCGLCVICASELARFVQVSDKAERGAVSLPRCSTRCQEAQAGHAPTSRASLCCTRSAR
jgi:hypothetical protein